MAAIQGITGFHDGEQVVINLYAKNPDGTVLDTPASQTITLVISASAGGAGLVEVSGSPQVVLNDAELGHWIITLDADDDLSSLTVGKAYHYAIWSTASGVSILQARGGFTLQRAPQLS